MWGWASPPLRIQLGPHLHVPCRMGGGEMTGGGGVGAVSGGERPPSPARLSHTSEKHPKTTLTELNLLRRHRELCDVVLNVGSRKIFAHRVILSACSPYFRAMFTGLSCNNLCVDFVVFIGGFVQESWRNRGKLR